MSVSGYEDDELKISMIRKEWSVTDLLRCWRSRGSAGDVTVAAIERDN